MMETNCFLENNTRILLPLIPFPLVAAFWRIFETQLHKKASSPGALILRSCEAVVQVCHTPYLWGLLHSLFDIDQGSCLVMGVAPAKSCEDGSCREGESDRQLRVMDFVLGPLS
jgi:hypothetical protein